MLIKYDPFKEFRVLSDVLLNDFYKEVKQSDLGKGFPVYDQFVEEDRHCSTRVCFSAAIKKKSFR